MALVRSSLVANHLWESLFRTAASGIYCFSGLSFAPHAIAVTLGVNGNAWADYATLAAPECPVGAQLEVETRDTSLAATDTDFYITFN